MGLDTVELVMAVEDRFQIEIPDAVATTLETVGSLHAFVVAELLRLNRQCDAREVFETLRKLICDQIGVKPERVLQWSGLGTTFEFIPVVPSAQTQEVVAPHLE